MKFSMIARSGALLAGAYLAVSCGGSSTPQHMDNGAAAEEPSPSVLTVSKVVADAGSDQTVSVGHFASLSGVGSRTDDSQMLDFKWRISEQPPTSNALIQHMHGVRAPFLIDQPGRYVAELSVDAGGLTAIDYVVITTENSPPLARILGPQHELRVGEIVYLDATTSSDVDGQLVVYEWQLIAQPAGSIAQFDDPAAARPAILLDKPGEYSLSLTVHDLSSSSEPVFLTFSTENLAPRAVAGRDRAAQPGDRVALHGGASWDPDGDSLDYSWTLVARPDGSRARINAPHSIEATLPLDAPGDYAVQLRTTDSSGAESVDSLLVTTGQTSPIALAGPDRAASKNSLAMLDGSGSVDASGAVLEYQWGLLSKPAGSNAKIAETAQATANLLPDKQGIYVAQLIVTAAGVKSEPDTVIVAVGENLAPVAAAGQYIVAAVDRVVGLDGSASFDPNNDALSFLWALIHRPEGSNATLSNRGNPSTLLVPDVPGFYVAQLTVSDGMLSGEPKSVMIKAVTEATPGTIAPGDRMIAFSSTADGDGDGVVDALDNCVLVANAQQADTDNDGYGNACDGDLDQNGIVDGSDSALLRLALERGDLSGDLNGDGVVDVLDISYLQTLIARPPGPSGADPDMDMVPAAEDNCYLVNNPVDENGEQEDSDGDGFGNPCDADLSNDGSVNFLDLGAFKLALDSGVFVPEADLDLNGAVDLDDLDVMLSYFYHPPGPSGLLPPTIVPTGGQFVPPNTTLSIQLRVLNPNRIPYLLTAAQLPENSDFNPETGEFSFMPDDTQLGLRTSVLFSISDGTVGTSRAVPLRVGLPGIVGIAPANGERSVRNDRPIYVRFDVPVDEDTITDMSVQAFINDATPDTQSREQVPAAVRLDFSGEIAVLTPIDSWSTQAASIRLRVDGNTIMDRSASPMLIDADGDGQAGGVFEADFDTAPLTQIANSSVCGVVYDAISSLRGDPEPIMGVKVSVEGLPSLEQLTDGSGFFRLDNVPVPELFVTVDPSTASQPSEATYLGITQSVESVAGQSPTCEPDADLYEIFLYALPGAVEPVPVNEGEETSVGLGDAVIQGSGSAIFPDIDPIVLEELLSRFAVTLPPGTSDLIDELAAYLLAPDALPVPLPSNVSPSVVYGFAAFLDGMIANVSSIDGDLAFVFPNVDGFLPGETHLIYAYDEQAGDWLIVGTATVSADGSVLNSDAGFSDNSLGLHFVGPEGSLASGLIGESLPGCAVGENNSGAAALCEVSAVGELGSCLSMVRCLDSAASALQATACLASAASSCSVGELGTSQACEACDTGADLTPGAAAVLDLLEATRMELMQMSNLALSSAMSDVFDLADKMLFDELLISLNDAAGGNYLEAAEEALDAVTTTGTASSPLSSPVQYAVLIDGEVVQRGVTSATGSYQIGVPGGGQGIEVVFFDAIGWSFAIVHLDSDAAAAGLLQVPGFSLSSASEAADSDSDGLADFAEAVLGTDAFSQDSDGDGILDGAEVRQGLDPLSDVLPAMGSIGGVTLLGEAVELVTAGGRADSQRQTTYVATTVGMAIVDTTQPDNPVLRGQRLLPGTPTDITLAGGGSLVALASDQGVYIVDVSDPPAPELMRTAQPAAGAFAVEATDWQLFVGGQERLYALDAHTGQIFDEITVTGRVIDIAREGDLLYVLTDDRVLQLFDISGALVLPQGSVSINAPVSRVFVGNDYAWIALGVGRGVAVVNATDPLLPVLETEHSGIGNIKTVLNGSGLAVVATGAGLEIYKNVDPMDPGNLGDLMATIENPPENANSIAVSAGIGMVADGVRGLQVINYEPFDIAGIPPTAEILEELLDELPDSDGVQVTEGSVIRVRTAIRDDVQVRNVELFVDDLLQANDIAFPFDVFADIPLIADVDDARASINVRATDTGGNEGNATSIVFELRPDDEAPSIGRIDPVEGSIQAMDRDTVRLVFSEPIRRSSVSGTSVVLRRTDGPLTEYTEPEVTFVNRDRIALLRYTNLEPGFYEVAVDREVVTDRKGNSLSGGAGAETSAFQLVDSNAVWVNPVGGEWNDPINWWGNKLPGPGEDVYISLPAGATVTHSGGQINTGNVFVNGDLTMSGGVAMVGGILLVNGTLTLSGVELQGATILTSGSGDVVIAGRNSVVDSVVFNSNAMITNNSALTVLNQLELNAQITMIGNGGDTDLLFAGDDALLSGNGEILLSGGISNRVDDLLVTAVEGDSLTIGAGIAIRTDTNSGQIGLSGSGLVNNGTIESGVAGKSIEIVGAPVENTAEGYIGALNGGIVRITGDPFLNAIGGYITAINGGTVSLRNDWTNRGVIEVQDGGTIGLGSTFSAANLGEIDASGTGALSIIGTLENTGRLFDLGVYSQNWFLNGGTINGGTVRGDSATLTIKTLNSPGGGGGSLNRVILEVNTVIENFNTVTVLDSLELNATITMIGDGGDTDLLFAGDDALLSGNGEILFSGGISNRVDDLLVTAVEGDSLTIGAGIAIRTDTNSGQVGLSGSGLVNNGTIESGVAGKSIEIVGGPFENAGGGMIRALNGGSILSGSEFENSGTIEVSGQSIFTFDGNWTNEGEVFLADGGAVVLSGTFTTDRIGAIGATSGTGAVRVVGVLDNSDAILNFDNYPETDWSLNRGTIRNGLVAGARALTVPGTGSAIEGTLENVTLSGTLEVQARAVVNVVDSLILDQGTVLLNRQGAYPLAVDFLHQQDGEFALLGGEGQVVFAGSGTQDDMSIRPAAPDEALLIDSGIEIRLAVDGVSTNSARVGAAGRALTNRGTIYSEAGVDRRIELVGTPLINEGTVVVSGQSIFTFDGNWTNEGEVFLADGGAVVLSGTFTTDRIGAIGATSGTGAVRVVGVLDNSDAILNFDNYPETDWSLNRGTIRNGLVAGARALTVPGTGSAVEGTLENVTLSGTLEVQARAVVNVVDSLILDQGTVLLNRQGAYPLAVDFLHQQDGEFALLGGEGQVVFAGSGTQDDMSIRPAAPDEALLIDSGIEIRLAVDGVSTNSARVGAAGRALTNRGTIYSEAGVDRRIELVGTPLINEGTVVVSGQSIFTFDGNWTNEGEVFLADGGAVVLSGTFTTDRIGAIGATSGTGAVRVVGVLDNSDAILNFDNYPETDWSLNRGTIRNGLVAGARALTVPGTGSAVEGTLENVTLSGTLEVQARAVVNVVDSLILDQGTVLLNRQGAYPLAVDFLHQQDGEFALLGGEGQVVFAGSGTQDDMSIRPAAPDEALLIDSGIEIRLAVDGVSTNSARVGAAGRALTNRGTIYSEAGVDRRIELVGTPLINEGTVVVSGQSIFTFDGNWTNEGEVFLADGGAVVLSGTFTTDRIGAIGATSGTGAVRVVGVLDNSDAILNFDNYPETDWSLNRGTIRNGLVAGARALTVPGTGSAVEGILENVTLSGTLEVQARAVVNVVDSLILDQGTVLLNRQGAYPLAVDFLHQQDGEFALLGGEGQVVFAGSGTQDDMSIRPAAPDEALLIDSGIEIRLAVDGVSTNSARVGAAGRALTNRGTIYSEAGVDRRIQLVGGPLINEGIFQIDNGGTLTVLGDLSNSGTLSINSGGLISVSGDLNLTPTSSIFLQIGGIEPEAFSRTLISGAIVFDGNMSLSVVGGFKPLDNQTFQIMTYASRSSEFANIDGLDLGNSLVLVPIYNPDNLTMQAQPN